MNKFGAKGIKLMTIVIGEKEDYADFYKFDPYDLIFNFENPTALLQQEVVDDIVGTTCEVLAVSSKSSYIINYIYL